MRFWLGPAKGATLSTASRVFLGLALCLPHHALAVSQSCRTLLVLAFSSLACMSPEMIHRQHQTNISSYALAENSSELVSYQLSEPDGELPELVVFSKGWVHQAVASQIKSLLEKEQPDLNESPSWKLPGWHFSISHVVLKTVGRDDDQVRMEIHGSGFSVETTRTIPKQVLFSGNVVQAVFDLEKVYPHTGTATVRVTVDAQYDARTKSLTIRNVQGKVIVKNSLMEQSDQFKAGPWLATPVDNRMTSRP